jgi:hypothetical protein
MRRGKRVHLDFLCGRGRKKGKSIAFRIWQHCSFMASTPTKVFSLQGKSLKLDSRLDIEPHLEDVDPTVIEEIHLGGNTIGVEAAETLAKFLEKTTVLKVWRNSYSVFKRPARLI